MNQLDRDKKYLSHILESIDMIEDYLADTLETEFYRNQQLQDSVIRRLEIIGEASKLVSEDLKKLSPQIAWREATDMRNFLIHAYFGIDYKIIWQTVINELPSLKKEIEKIFLHLS